MFDPARMHVKALRWMDPRGYLYKSGKGELVEREQLHTPTWQEVDDMMNMRGSFHTPNEWVGLHIYNLLDMPDWMNKIEPAIAERVKNRPDLKPAYDLFMKPFR